MENLKSSNPLEHAEIVKAKLQEVSDHLRKDLDKVDNPQAQALFETSAEVLDGLINAFSLYQKRSDQAWS